MNQRRCLLGSTADNNENHCLELPGAWDPQAIRALSDMLREKDPKIIFISETRLLKRCMKGVKAKMGYANGFCVDCRNTGRGLALL